MKGSYVLLIELKKNTKQKIGMLGTLKFEKGYYAYVGSAMNNLQKRIERHCKKTKKMRWHIDYFLQKADIMHIFFRINNKKEECNIANDFTPTEFSFVPNFGSSDCRCPSHLFYCKNVYSFYLVIKKWQMNSFL